MVFPKDWNMSTLSKLSFLAMALALASCNEKVSPELQGANSASTTTGTTVVLPSDFYFRVVNTSDTMLNYKLHKTGAGNANVNCEITSNLALSSDLYRADPSSYDITCFLEAEELALSLNGLKYAVEASKNTCEYIGYSPFSYYNYQPGNSTQSLQKLTCASGATPNMARAANAAINGNITCDAYINTEAGADPFAATSDQAICNFDYTNIPGFPADAPNCDDGVLTITEYTATGVDTTVPSDQIPDIAEVTEATRVVKCGGKPVNCIEGAIKLTSLAAKFTSGTETTKATVNDVYRKEYTLPATFGIYPSNRRYVNYRRDLASTEIEYGSSDREFNDGDSLNDSTLTNGYMSSFGDPLYKSDYDPNVMSFYSNNKRMDGTTLVSNATLLANKFNYFRGELSGGAFSRGIPYAADPFVGLNGHKTNAFYSFYCFDAALDVRARVKMVVREWDRQLPASATSEYFERISDVDLLPPYARQDVPYTQEVTGDPDSWNDFNDIADWDDFIDMERDDSNVPYDPSITIFRPLPKGNFTDGFLNPYVFPMESLE
jgi:hypothetical protein